MQSALYIDGVVVVAGYVCSAYTVFRSQIKNRHILTAYVSPTLVLDLELDVLEGGERGLCNR